MQIPMSSKDRIKLSCLVACLLLAAAILLTDNAAIETAHGFSAGPPAGRTGAPGELTCATSGCHGTVVNVGPGRFTITAPATYEPGETYQIKVEHTSNEASRRRWGFQLTALTLGNDKAGNLLRGNSPTSILDDDGPGFDRQYIEHTQPGTFQGQRNLASWTFNWVAPSSDVGPVIFYAAGNQANNDGNITGDQIYTAFNIVLSGPPRITDALVDGKRLIVIGENFAEGAELRLNGVKEKKVAMDEGNLTTQLIAKKSGKKVGRGQTVILQVKNPDGATSEDFEFRRPD